MLTKNRLVYTTQQCVSILPTGASVLHIKRGNYRLKEEMTRLVEWAALTIGVKRNKAIRLYGDWKYEEGRTEEMTKPRVLQIQEVSWDLPSLRNVALNKRKNVCLFLYTLCSAIYSSLPPICCLWCLASLEIQYILMVALNKTFDCAVLF